MLDGNRGYCDLKVLDDVWSETRLRCHHENNLVKVAVALSTTVRAVIIEGNDGVVKTVYLWERVMIVSKQALGMLQDATCKEYWWELNNRCCCSYWDQITGVRAKSNKLQFMSGHIQKLEYDWSFIPHLLKTAKMLVTNCILGLLLNCKYCKIGMNTSIWCDIQRDLISISNINTCRNVIDLNEDGTNITKAQKEWYSIVSKSLQFSWLKTLLEEHNVKMGISLLRIDLLEHNFQNQLSAYNEILGIN